MSRALAAPRIGPPGIRNPAGFRDPGEIVAALRNDPDTLLFYDAADPRYDGGQIPFDAAYRHFDGYLGSLWPANIAPAGYEPTTDLVVDLPGTAGNYLSTPDAAALDITGDIDLRAKIAPDDWTPAVNQIIVGKWAESYMMWLNTSGRLELLWYESTVLHRTTSTVATGFADGSVSWVRATLDVSTGFANFYTSTDGTSWTQLGTADQSDATNPGVTSIDAGTVDLAIGIRPDNGVSGPFAGLIYAVELYDGIAGTKVVDLDFTRDAKAGETSSVTDLLGNVWTFNGTLEVTDENGLSPNTKALRLPGTSGNYVSTPDTASLDITGDIDIRAYVAADDWTPAALQFLVGKWAGGADNSFDLRVDTGGTLTFRWRDDGAAATRTVTSTAAVVASSPVWVRVTLDVDNGAGSHDVNFYTSTDGTSWTQLGTADLEAATATTQIQSGAGAFEIGSSTVGTSPFDGLIYAVEVYDGIAGTKVVDVDFDRDAGLYDTSFTGNDGLTYTVNQSAATTNDPLVFGAGANADVPFTGEKYIYFPGTTGNTVTTPDAANFSLADNGHTLSIRVKLAPRDGTWAGFGDTELVTKYTTSGNQREWRLRIAASSNSPQFFWSTDGTAISNAADNAIDMDAVFTDGEPGWVRVDFTPDNGANAVVDWFYSVDGETWVNTETDTLASSSIFAGSSDVWLAAYNNGGHNDDALIYAVQVINNGTTVIDLDVNRDTIAADHSTITDAKGNVWTVNRSAAPSFQTSIIDRPCWLFGADTWIEVPDSADWTLTKTAVIAGRFTSDVSGVARLLCHRANAGGEGWMIFVVNATSGAIDSTWNDGTENVSPAGVAHTIGQRYVASTIFNEGTGITTRTNGTEADSANPNLVAPDYAGPLRVGMTSDTTIGDYSGEIHFTAVFNRALTEAELQALEAVYG